MRPRTLAPAVCLCLLLPLWGAGPVHGECLYGNADGAAVSAWPHTAPGGGDRYAVLVEPALDPCGEEEEEGVLFGRVGVRLWVPAGAGFDCAAQLLAAVDDGSGCLAPGDVLQTSPPLVVDAAAESGPRELLLPSGFVCAAADRPYFLVFALLPHAQDLQLGMTATTAACASYADVGGGFIDLGSAGWGAPAVYAVAESCPGSAPTAPLAWDALKAVFRR